CVPGGSSGDFRGSVRRQQTRGRPALLVRLGLQHSRPEGEGGVQRPRNRGRHRGHRGLA
ncbi:unnamed protein product, partial [Ectocarpus sp. 13 AM-2016]